MCSNSNPTLAQRVLSIISEERPGVRTGPLAVEHVEREPHDGSRPTVRERDMREWGLVYGLAFGLLLGEYPDATQDEREKHAARALDAARAAHVRWTGDIAPRPDATAIIDAVLFAYEDAGNELDRLRYIEKQPVGELVERLEDLRATVGVPNREAVTI